MDKYIVSARKYRPATFDSVVGQHALTTTLKNAIATGKLAHAYLFCGPRGVGKTTCARIFAKTINCLAPLPGGEACNNCESCQAFNEGRSYNIHELDAASNNSVEDIRSLIDQVMMPPQVGRYKVFIIDEVHMLSQAAFNAFLKTLEEPPLHAIFILATTEKHKILPTILSRCQIYDFNRMEVSDIIGHLKRVAAAEGIACEEEALAVIARKADGGMRDAMSIFDQVSSYSGGDITYKKVIENLNMLDYDYYFKMVDVLLKPDIPAAMLLLNDILSRGFEGNHFVSGLASHFRDLLVSRDEQTLGLLEVADNVREKYREQASRCRPSFLFRALKLCNNCDINYRVSSNRRLLVELTLIEVAQGEDDSEGCGRGPTKKLKPLFKQTQPVSQTAAASSRHHEKPVAVADHAPAQEHRAAPRQLSVSPAQEEPVSGVAEAPAQLQMARPARTLSIRAAVSKTGREPVAQRQGSGRQEARSEENAEFAQKDLSYQWYRYAVSLPQEQSAMAGRMKNIEPLLADGWTVEVPVENDLVRTYMEEIRPSVTDFLRKELHNSHITLKYRLIVPEERKKAYTRKEILAMILQKNAALQKLTQALSLELA